MREMARYGFVLMFICIVASGLLAGVNYLTRGRIYAQAQAEEEASLKEVMPEAERFEPVFSNGSLLYYRAIAKEGLPIGIVFKASGKGYGGAVETLAGLAPDGRITAIKVTSHNETPGLGARVAEEAFGRQFRGKMAADLGEVDVISGATISSKAVIDSVQKKAGELLALIKDE